MAFKPIIVEEEIDGVLYKAQFNGMASRNKIVNMAQNNIEEATEYMFAHVLVEPKIGDVDEYFGTDADHYDKVVVFMTKVGSANKDYFPASDRSANKGKSK